MVLRSHSPRQSSSAAGHRPLCRTVETSASVDSIVGWGLGVGRHRIESEYAGSLGNRRPVWKSRPISSGSASSDPGDPSVHQFAFVESRSGRYSPEKVCRAAHFALLAQLVEHFHGKEGVIGSSPMEGLSDYQGFCLAASASAPQKRYETGTSCRRFARSPRRIPHR